MFSQILWSSLIACSGQKHVNPDASVVLDDETTVEQSELNGTTHRL